MTTADKSQDEKTALLNEQEGRQNTEEAKFPAFETDPRQTDAQEVIFPAVETTPTTEELESLFAEAGVPAAVPQEVSAAEKKEPAVKTEKPSGKRKWILLFGGLAIIAVGISIFFYLQSRPKPVPTPTSVDLPTQTSTTASDMPETAFMISPEKQQLIGVQYSTVEYQTMSKSLRAVGKVAYDETEMSRINPKIEGWIENVYVDFTGRASHCSASTVPNWCRRRKSICLPSRAEGSSERVLSLKQLTSLNRWCNQHEGGWSCGTSAKLRSVRSRDVERPRGR